MKCPHCLVDFHAHEELIRLGSDTTANWLVSKFLCSSCERANFSLTTAKFLYSDGSADDRSPSVLFYPKGMSRPPLAPSVPTDLAKDYVEACLVLPDSPSASAALSRRCLQSLLRNHVKVKPGDLSKEIDEVLATKTLPSHLSESIDAIRNIGNFAAHPAKDKTTGEIVEVETGEAEWNLDVLEGLFDFYFVQPAVTKAKRDALNQKLQAAGKPLLKQ